VLLVASGSSVARADVATQPVTGEVEGEVLVWFDEAVGPAEARRRLEELGASEIERRFTPGLYRVRIGAAVGEEAGLRSVALPEMTRTFLDQVATLPHVLGAEPHFRGSGGYEPGDPLVDRQWYLDNANGADIGAKKAWSLTRGSSDVTIAVIDSGLLLDHPEFEGRLAVNAAEYPPNGQDDDGNGLVDDYQGWDFFEGDGEPQDEHGHGTWTTSVLAANAGNDFGIAGIDHASRLLILRVLGPDNGGTMADLIDALTYVSQRDDVDLVNLSLVRFPASALLGTAIERAAEQSILVACAGNDGPGTADTMYPGGHPATISVGSTDTYDGLASFSSTGTTLSLVAPGLGIEVVEIASPYQSDASRSVSGCSFAVPIVTGIAALLHAYDRGLDRLQVETYLAGSAQDLGDPGWDPEYGWGRVSAQRALKLLLAQRLFADGFESGGLGGWLLGE
jgi:subtilisin family serine protease